MTTHHGGYWEAKGLPLKVGTVKRAGFDSPFRHSSGRQLKGGRGKLLASLIIWSIGMAITLTCATADREEVPNAKLGVQEGTK